MFKKNDENKALILISLIALTITVLIIYQNSVHAILGHSYRDVFFYLIEALRFSGVNITGYAYVDYLPPVIPFLTSFLFRAGYVSTTSIFIVSGIFYFFGILAIYYILKLRFKPLYSFFGAFIYATLYINMKWVGNGTLDIAFISLVLWALYFFIKAMEDNQKYFYLAFPLAVISFFTKYPAGLIFPLMILYFMGKTNFFKNFKKYYKNIIGGVLAGIITLIPFVSYFIIYNIPFGFLNQAQDISSSTSLTRTHGGHLVGNDLFFYIKGMIYYMSYPNYLIGIIILAISIIGFILVVKRFKNNLKNSFKEDMEVKIFKWHFPQKALYCILAASIIFILFSFFTASLFSFVYSEIILFLGLYLFCYSFSKIVNNYNLSLTVTMTGLFLSYLIFFSAHLVKADRYFTSMAPGFIFIMTLSSEYLNEKINYKNLILIFMMILMIFTAVNCITSIQDNSLAIDEKNASAWLKNSDVVIASNRAPSYTWYLQKEVLSVNDLSNSTLVNKNLIDANVSYYLTDENLNLTNYKIVREIGSVNLYLRVYPPIKN